jgi:hypothetical protein
MTERRLFRFAYLAPSHKDRQRYPFTLRDGDAALYLADVLLRDHGYRYASPIMNYPATPDQPAPSDDVVLGRTDLVLLTTRPPMDDRILGDKKGIPRSYTALEEKLFSGPLRERFARCARSEILLTDQTANISPAIAARQASTFRQNGGAMYHDYGSPRTGTWQRFKQAAPLTAAFLLYEEEAWPGGPALLAAFGMGGTETLVWCYHLASRFRSLLLSTPFAMVEMRRGPGSDSPADIRFAEAWDVTLLGAAEPKPRRGPKVAA